MFYEESTIDGKLFYRTTPNGEWHPVPESPPMTPVEFAEKMRGVSDDTESGHMEADILMCDLLEQLGYGKGVGIFRNMHKWYA